MLSSDKNLPLKEELLLFSSMKNSYIKQNSGSGTKTTMATKTNQQDDAAAKQWIADAQLSSRPSSFRWSRSSSTKKKTNEQLYVLEDGYLLGTSSPSKEARGVEERFDDKDSIVTEIVKNTKSNDNDSTSSETIRTEIVNNNNIFDDAISVLTEPFGGFTSKAETIKYEPPTIETISDTSTTKKDTSHTKKTPSILLKTKAKVISAQKERQARKEKVLADMKELKKQKEIEKNLKIEKDRLIQIKKTADRVKKEVQAAEKIKSIKKKQSKKSKQKTLTPLPTVEESRTEVEDINVDMDVKRDDTMRKGISDKDIADAEILGLKEELSALKSMLSKIQRTESVAVHHQPEDILQVNKNLEEEVNTLRNVLAELVSNQATMILHLQGQTGTNQLHDINVSAFDPSSKSKKTSLDDNEETSTSNLFQWIMSCGGGESTPAKLDQESECDSSYAASTSTMSNSLASEDTGGHMSTDSDMNPEWFEA